MCACSRYRLTVCLQFCMAAYQGRYLYDRDELTDILQFSSLLHYATSFKAVSGLVLLSKGWQNKKYRH